MPAASEGRPTKGPRQVPPPPAAANTSRAVRADPGVWIGAAVAIAGILFGVHFEGGSLLEVLQPAAASIVVGGTFGAVLVQFPAATVLAAISRLPLLAVGPRTGMSAQAQELLRFGLKARLRGVLSLDADLEQIRDPYTRRCLMLAIDRMDAAEIEQVMEQACLRQEECDEQIAGVWETAGGYAPAIGILGAVLGLIRVMQQLDDLHQVGRGIAVAFVATLYGVGAANLVFLPIAGRLRQHAQRQRQVREMTLQMVLLIAAGASPRMLRERLHAWQMSGDSAPARRAG